MAREHSFGIKLVAGFGVAVAFTVLSGAISVRTMKHVVDAKDRVIDRDLRVLIDAARLETAAGDQVAALRGFLLTGEAHYLDQNAKAAADVTAILRSLEANGVDASVLKALEKAHADYTIVSAEVSAMRSSGSSPEQIEHAFIEKLRPKRRQLQTTVEHLNSDQTTAFQRAQQAASDAANASSRYVILIAVLAAVFAALAAFWLVRALNRQIGSAVGQVQSSSAELQAAANQQASGAREQATAMTEINTTISELLTTSRQIAESARRVANIAGQTAGSARTGQSTVNKAHEAIVSIQRQVEQIVMHMLDLGKKTQQIGVVLEIVSELAEQTNILAINATIEAIGAGDSGKRFAVVADEIRRLADRVTTSTKEIRSLIEEVRSAANTTVMATETGSKTVDAGSRHFGDVSSAFQQIAELVDTTTEAAREIELSTKQQASAVEQVNIAITNAVQATRENEASSAQTLQTAGQLAGLSRELLRVVQPT